MLTDRQISLRSRHSRKPMCWFNKVRANPSHFANLWSIWLSVCQKKTLTWRETLSKEELLIQWRNAVEIGIEQRCYLVLYNATRKPLYGCLTLFADAIGQHMQHFATLCNTSNATFYLRATFWSVMKSICLPMNSTSHIQKKNIMSFALSASSWHCSTWSKHILFSSETLKTFLTVRQSFCLTRTCESIL